jgi:hypothetical protein
VNVVNHYELVVNVNEPLKEKEILLRLEMLIETNVLSLPGLTPVKKVLRKIVEITTVAMIVNMEDAATAM